MTNGSGLTTKQITKKRKKLKCQMSVWLEKIDAQKQMFILTRNVWIYYFKYKTVTNNQRQIGGGAMILFYTVTERYTSYFAVESFIQNNSVMASFVQRCFKRWNKSSSKMYQNNKDNNYSSSIIIAAFVKSSAFRAPPCITQP